MLVLGCYDICSVTVMTVLGGRALNWIPVWTDRCTFLGF
jgi:hypothetical protein